MHIETAGKAKTGVASTFSFWLRDSDGNVGPVLHHPGDAGWPSPPKMTEAEYRLYGDLAESVRLLGNALTNASDAYALACKAHQQLVVGPDEVMNTATQALYELQEFIASEHRTLAAKAIERHSAFFTDEYRAAQERKIDGSNG